MKITWTNLWMSISNINFFRTEFFFLNVVRKCDDYKVIKI